MKKENAELQRLLAELRSLTQKLTGLELEINEWLAVVEEMKSAFYTVGKSFNQKPSSCESVDSVLRRRETTRYWNDLKHGTESK